MRVVFMGTAEFAVPSLQALANKHEVVAVYTKQDSVSGRGKTARPSPVKNVATLLGIPVYQPRTLRDDAEIAVLRELQPEVIIVAAYGLILPPAVLDIPRFGCINVHGSLLPKWRGAAPIQRAILADDTRAGVAIMQMEEGLDTGPYCVVMQTETASKNADELGRDLAILGADALLETLEHLKSGTDLWVEQDEPAATYAKKINKEEVTLSPQLTSHENVLRVRASGESAPSRTTIMGKGVRVIEASETFVDSSSSENIPAVAQGEVLVTKKFVALGALDAPLYLLKIKPDGKQAMDALAWARGIQQSENRWS